MSKVQNKISELFNTSMEEDVPVVDFDIESEPKPVICEVIDPVAIDNRIEDQLEKVVNRIGSDSDLARSTNHSLLSQTMGIIKELKAIAETSEEPRAYEVLAQWMNIAVALSTQTTTINDRTVSTIVKAKKIRFQKVPESILTVDNKTGNISGTTAEMQKLLMSEANETKSKEENVKKAD